MISKGIAINNCCLCAVNNTDLVILGAAVGLIELLRDKELASQNELI